MTDYMPGAACVGLEPGYWDTTTRNGHTSRLGSIRIDGIRVPRMKQISYAKAICAQCPVKGLCLRAGMQEPEGIWGGLLPDERGRL